MESQGSKICTSSCSAGTNIIQSSSGSYCGKCSSGQYYDGVNQSCVSQCPQYVNEDKTACVSSCESGQVSYTFNMHKYCATACPNQMPYEFDKVCFKTCPKNTYKQSHNSNMCVKSCRAGTNIIQSRDGSYCGTCKVGFHYDKNTQSCKTPEKYYRSF